MTTSDDLVQTWRRMLSSGERGVRLVEGHPLRILFGVTSSSQLELVLKTKEGPRILDFSRMVRAESQFHQGDSSWSLHLILEDLAYAEPFMAVCKEVIDRSGASENPKASLQLFYGALSKWHSLFRPSHLGRLTDTEMRGLAAELWFGAHRLSIAYSVPVIIDSWFGPFKADQDYRMPDSRAFEVKAAQIGAKEVRISSPEQLEPGTFSRLTLDVVTVESTDIGNENSLSLPSLAQFIRDQVQGDAQTLEKFENRLHAAGLVESDPYYSTKFFRFHGVREYVVGPGFPRIEVSNVPDGVTSVEYTISMQSLKAFELMQTP